MQDGGLGHEGARTQSGAPLLVTRGDGLAEITLDRPAARNALSIAMIDALSAAIADLSKDRAVHAVVVSANGPVFSSGHDLKELTARRTDADGGRAFYAEAMARCAAMMQAILASPKPFIAAVEGPATAAGCQLVATCDLAVADIRAQFCTPGVNIGLFCSTPMVALSRNVPRKRALEMLLLGDMLGAEEAASYGLVNRVVAAGSARTAAREMAARIASKSPLTVGTGKAAFYAQIERPVAEAYTYAANFMVENMMARDAAEGIGAFIEKRPPVWTGC